MAKAAPLFDFKQKVNYKKEILAGWTVAMTMIPESLSFAILAGLSPLTGLYAAFMMGLVTALFGGRPGMVSGGAGATIIVLIALIKSHGTEYLFAAVILAGILQFAVGALKFGKFIRLIPQPVMYGFLNGLAIIIFMSQVEQFKIPNGNSFEWLSGSTLYTMAGLTLLTILIVWLLPKLTKAIPASLAAIIVVSVVVIALQLPTKTVGDIAAIKGNLPDFSIPALPFTWETLTIIFPYALVMAGVGLIESLLTLSVVDEITQTKGKPNREAMAQGGANFINGFFGGMGGCAMIAQTLVNINAGSRARLSAIVGALTIMLIILFGSSIIEKIPMAALVGVMMVVAIQTFQWVSIDIVNKMPRSDIFTGILVAAITVLLHNLALAVFAGVIIAALVFAWDNAKRIRAHKYINEEGVKVYAIYGPLFFGSVMHFEEKFDILNDPDQIIIDFNESRVADMSAINILTKLAQKYAAVNKKVILKHLSKDCIKKLEKAQVQIIIDQYSDPAYRVMD